MTASVRYGILGPNDASRTIHECASNPAHSWIVRYGILGPNDASRTIHECAGLLGLQLAAEIPVTTILISGMRKKATENDIRQAFSVFGDVVTAAVASNERGFGILRFTSDDAVDRAMKKFKTEEVVVEDVAVQLRVIKPGSHN